MSIERVVAILTPLFTAAAGAISTGVGSAVGIPKQDFVALFVAGATVAVGAALTWLHGRAKFVQAAADAEHWVAHETHAVLASPLAGPAAADIEQLLKAHTDQIVAAIGSSVHAPPTVEQVMQAMARAAVQAQPPPLATPVSA